MANDNNIDNNIEEEEEIFSQKDTSDVISEILQKYELDENGEEIFEKLEKVEPLRGEIILDLAIQIIQKKISPKELAPLLQKQLTVPPKIAEDLSQDIETKLLDLVKESLERKPLVAESHIPTKIEPLQALFEKQSTEESFIAKRPTPRSTEENSLTPTWKKSPRITKQPKISEEIIRGKETKKTLKKEQEKPKSQDIYREPIE